MSINRHASRITCVSINAAQTNIIIILVPKGEIRTIYTNAVIGIGD